MTEENLNKLKLDLDKGTLELCDGVVNALISQARRALTLEKENAELRKFKERLDWSIKHHQTFSDLVWDNGPYMDIFNVYSSEVYKAIDKAMRGE